jgi:glycosyltransferase involved in cell wall biosynthesis
MHAGYQKFEVETWEHVDRITCMSPYVRDALISVGVPPNQITVIPYPWNEPVPDIIERENRSGPLTIGFVGAVGLRKGCPYFLEVARRFDPKRFKFVMVGDVLLDKDRLGPYQDHVTFTGKVPRSAVKGWLAKFDIFFFPSTCEGSAGAVMEAMASGLAVLTTPSSGSVVEHGIDGFVYDHHEIGKFESAIRQLDGDRDLLSSMGQSGRRRVLSYNLKSYGADLKNLFEELLNGESNIKSANN